MGAKKNHDDTSTKTGATGENCLGELSADEFLEKYWQQKPLLIRNAFPNMQSPLSADELAGLACEEHVNARIVLENASNAEQDKPWQLEFGPFAESRFSSLPDSHWSLLVSDVDRHLPETKVLLNAFRFIPDWRVDDLMVSYAPPGGSVGAHVDAYDVFLIQLSGQRLWKISEHFPTETLANIDLCILKNFNAENEWVLNAGDMLYLPPNVAHHGIAMEHSSDPVNDESEACMTASVGFRAPAANTLLNEYAHFLNDASLDTARYRDSSPLKPKHHAEITDETVTQLIDFLKQGLTFEHEKIRQWLGEHFSDNKVFEDIADELHDKLDNVNYEQLCEIAAQSKLQQSPYSNFLFSYSKQKALLFVNGISYQVSKRFAETICEDEINFESLQQVMQAGDKEVLLTLFNSGAILSAIEIE